MGKESLGSPCLMVCWLRRVAASPGVFCSPPPRLRGRPSADQSETTQGLCKELAAGAVELYIVWC
jgi:hypothetical protein